MVEVTIQNAQHGHGQGASTLQREENTETEVQNNIHLMSTLLTLNCLFAVFVLFNLSTWKLVVTGIHLCPTSE